MEKASVVVWPAVTATMCEAPPPTVQFAGTSVSAAVGVVGAEPVEVVVPSLGWLEGPRPAAAGAGELVGWVGPVVGVVTVRLPVSAVQVIVNGAVAVWPAVTGTVFE